MKTKAAKAAVASPHSYSTQPAKAFSPGGRLFAKTPDDFPTGETDSFAAEPGPSPRLEHESTGRRPSFEEVSARAYQLWQQSGCVNDQHLDHWYEAEHQLDEELGGTGLQTSVPVGADQLGAT